MAATSEGKWIEWPAEKPTAEDFANWKQDPVTRWVFKELELMKQDYSVATGEGASYDERSTEATALKTAESIGFVNGLGALMRIEIKEG